MTGLPTCREGQIIATRLQNTVAYLYYRIYVESVPGRPDGYKFVVLRDIEMFAYTTGNQFLKRCDKKNVLPQNENFKKDFNSTLF